MVRSVRRPGWWLLWAAVLCVAGALLALSWASSQPAYAAKDCGGFTLTVVGGPADGTTFSGDVRRNVEVGRGATLQVRGDFVEFDVDLDTFTVNGYTLTGTPAPTDITGGRRTTIFESKVPNHGTTLTGPVELRLGAERNLRLQRSGGGQDMKIQAKDCTQGGIFQMEPEPSITETNTLAAGFTYEAGTPGQTGRLCFTNGTVVGYDSPENAALVSSTAREATWDVAAGGRVGMVLGEDALEGGCTP